MKYFFYRLKWHLAPYISFSAPVHIDLELNNTCNQKCVMCWHSADSLPFIPDKMDVLTVASALNYIITHRVKSVKFNWRGEPLIRAGKVSSLASYLKNFNIHTMINTNGTMLEKSFHMPPDLSEIIVSVDSLHPAIYPKIHGAPFDMLSLIKFLTMQKTRTRIKLNFHENKYNIYELKHLPKLPFKTVIRRTEKRSGQDISNPIQERQRKTICPHIMRRLTIAANGKIFPCCMAYAEPDDLCLGYDIHDAWHSDKRKALIKNYRKGIYTATCKNCTSGDIWK